MPSTYCLLSNGDLHFLPYHHKNSTDISLTRSDIDEVARVPDVSPSPPNATVRLSSPSSLPGTNGTTGPSFHIYSSVMAGKASAGLSAVGTSSSLVSNGSSSSFSQRTPSESSDSSDIDDTMTGTVVGHPSVVHPSFTHAPMVSQLLEKYCAHAIYLADRFIEPSNSGKQKADIKEMLLDIFSHWNHNPQLIQLHELTGGITNMLLECSYPSADQSKPAEKVLVRTYGRGTNLIIDRDREFVSHLVLNSYNLAPPIHARFGNGLVYGFIEGRALQFEEMSDSHLYPFIASRLGEWHRLIDVDVIEESLRKLRRRFGKSGMLDSRSGKKPDNVWVLMKNWVEILPEISGMAHVCDENKDIQEVRRHNRTPTSVKEILSDELKWLKREIGDKSPLVAAHSDLLSGNIIMPSEFSDSLKDPQKADALVASYREKKVNPISFIDYEYMMPGPRAFDISNHFQEWQGFNCDKSLIPEPVKDNELLRTWCTSYLQTDDTKQVSSEVVDSLIEEISLYYGMPGFYWGIWAGIQSTISLIDFDYGGYSGERLVEYWNWKRAHLNEAVNL